MTDAFEGKDRRHRYLGLFDELGAIGAEPEGERVQGLLNAASGHLVALIRGASREDLDQFHQAARSALHRVSSLNEADASGRLEFWLGQLNLLVEIAQTAAFQKVPRHAVAALEGSDLKRAMVEALREHGRLRVTDLAARIGKYSQNLATPARELESLGLIDREEFGRSVYLSTTALGSIALDQVPHRPGAAASVPLADVVPAPRFVPEPATHMAPFVMDVCNRLRLEDERSQRIGATRAAIEFEQRFGSAAPGSRMLPGHESIARQQLVRKLADCGSYLLRDNELFFVGSDPAVYLPNVLTPLKQGIALDVARFLQSTQGFIQDHVLPGTGTQLLLAVAERQMEQSDQFQALSLAALD